jgi:hypothetical protein
MATEARRRAQAKYNSKPEQVKRRMARNRARAAMIKAGKARKGDGKDVGHANGNPHDNRRSNLRMESQKANRSYRRTRGGHKKNPRD